MSTKKQARDKLKAAVAKSVDNSSPHMFVMTGDVLALLDELEALDRRNAELNSTLERWATDRAQSASELDEAEKRIAENDRQCDQHYLNGMLAGWNFGITEDSDGYDSAFSARNKLIVAERAAGITVKGDSE